QSSGIEQVNQAVVQMDDATQQNAALVEEAAAAAESLQNQAAKLAEAVSVFKLSASYRQRPEPSASRREPAALPKARGGASPARAIARPVKSKNAGNEDWEEF
ncbi:MAG: hypothetical protein Q7J36_06970, partial [Thiobacillus sp.]|nr:hypothetical protein [Thiobacillus sp.]